jgi:SAM-dependent methyltransferase
MPDTSDMWVGEWDGDRYQVRFGALAASGADVHGEAGFVMGLSPSSVLDAGCGTGRVAIELARRGIDVVGVDPDPSMISTAQRLAPELMWVRADMGDVQLDRRFDLVVMAGNVPLFTPPGTQATLVAGCARHLLPGGRLVCGFQVDRGYGLADYDDHCRAAGLVLLERWATWDRQPFTDGGDYAVSVHRLA